MIILVLHLNLNKKIIGVTTAGSTKDVGIMVSLKFLSKLWRTLAILLINFELALKMCVI